MVVDIQTRYYVKIVPAKRQNMKGSWQILDVYGDFLLAKYSSPNHPTSLFVAKFDDFQPKKDSDELEVFWNYVGDQSSLKIMPWDWEILTLMREGFQMK